MESLFIQLSCYVYIFFTRVIVLWSTVTSVIQADEEDSVWHLSRQLYKKVQQLRQIV